MSWEWSYTQEGIQNIRDNIGTMSREDLIECLSEFHAAKNPKPDDWDGTESEWQESQAGGDTYFDNDDFKKKTDELTKFCLDQETLADVLFDEAEQLRTCENGGHRAWVCPYGCHTVSLDSPIEKE